jgi:peptidoglycan hydrolase-like protein with peptidoglycan-binding domain
VLYVQILLTDWLLVNKNTTIAIDGLVGSETIGAIRQFQAANTAVVDGLVEPNRSTINALENKHIATLLGSTELTAQASSSRTSGTDSPAIEPGLADAYLNMLRGKG